MPEISEGEIAFLILLRQIAPDLEQKGIFRQYRFAMPRRFRFDFAFPDQGVAVEVDGGQWAPGGGRHAKDSDREKMNVAAALGWRVLHVSPDMLRTRPQEFFKLLREALSSHHPRILQGNGRGES